MGAWEDGLAAIDTVVSSIAEREHVPGIACGLIRDGELVHTGGVGTLASGTSKVPDENSVFRIASMSKSFTGSALMTLVAEGRVRLDEPVATYVPEASALRA